MSNFFFTILQQLGKYAIDIGIFVEFQAADRNFELRNRRRLSRNASAGVVFPVKLILILPFRFHHSAICSSTVRRILPYWSSKGGMCDLAFVIGSLSRTIKSRTFTTEFKTVILSQFLQRPRSHFLGIEHITPSSQSLDILLVCQISSGLNT